jgi:hypothetical protein
MQSLTENANRMIKICDILAAFFHRVTIYFNGVLADVELGFLYRYFSGQRLAEGRNTVIAKEKETTET